MPGRYKLSMVRMSHLETDELANVRVYIATLSKDTRVAEATNTTEK